MATSTIKRQLVEKVAFVGTSDINTAYTNTGHSADIRFRRIGQIVTMTGYIKIGTNITAELNTHIFTVPEGFRPYFSTNAVGGHATDTTLCFFYCNGTKFFARFQARANETYQFSATWIAA